MANRLADSQNIKYSYCMTQKFQTSTSAEKKQKYMKTCMLLFTVATRFLNALMNIHQYKKPKFLSIKWTHKFGYSHNET